MQPLSRRNLARIVRYASRRLDTAHQPRHALRFLMTDVVGQDFSESGFAWQLGAGANYEVSPGVKVGVGYRYFHGADIDRAFGAKNSAPAQTDGSNHAIQASVTVDLN